MAITRHSSSIDIPETQVIYHCIDHCEDCCLDFCKESLIIVLVILWIILRNPYGPLYESVWIERNQYGTLYESLCGLKGINMDH